MLNSNDASIYRDISNKVLRDKIEASIIKEEQEAELQVNAVMALAALKAFDGLFEVIVGYKLNDVSLDDLRNDKHFTVECLQDNGFITGYCISWKDKQ